MNKTGLIGMTNPNDLSSLKVKGIKDVNDLEQVIEALKQEYATMLDQHQLKMFDASEPRIGIDVREPIPAGDDDEDEDGGDDYDEDDGYYETGDDDSYSAYQEASWRNSYLMDMIIDECEHLGASVRETSAMVTEISWPKALTIGEVQYPLFIDEERFLLPVEAGSFAVYAAWMYQLILRGVELMEGECSGPRIEAFS